MSDALRAPWFAPIAGLLAELGPQAGSGSWQACLVRLNELAGQRGLVNAQGRALEFIDAARARPIPYESHVWQYAQVPTRTGEGAWHDFFNALVWLTFPRLKAQLNALQALAIARDGVGARRGGLRDAATLFDENAALVVAGTGPALSAWRRHDWHGFFQPHGLAADRHEADRAEAGPTDVDQAESGQTWLPVLFGHALLDKLRAPYKSVCAHAWVIVDPDLLDAAGASGLLAMSPPVPSLPVSSDGSSSASGSSKALAAFIGRLDGVAAQALCEPILCREKFLPLPVLGVAGWWPDNRQPGFYDDRTVFRPMRTRSLSTD